MAIAMSSWAVTQSVAVADDGEFYTRLSYSVPPPLRGCADEGEFRRRIARQLGYDPFRDDAAASVRIQVGGSAKAIGGQVEWRDKSGKTMGERRFVAKDGNCGRLLAEMGFAVSLQIQLLRPPASRASDTPVSADAGKDGRATVAAGPTSSENPAIPEAPSDSPGPLSTPAPRPTETESGTSRRDLHSEGTSDQLVRELPSAPSRWSVWVGAGPSVAWGLAPSSVATARLFMGVRRDHLSLEVAAEGSYPSTDQKWGGSGFRELILGANLGICDHHSFLAGCALAKVGQLRVEGSNVDSPRSAAAFVAQTGLRLAPTLTLGRSWLIAGHVDGLVSLTSSRVRLNDTSIWEMPRFSFYAGVDLAVRLW